MNVNIIIHSSIAAGIEIPAIPTSCQLAHSRHRLWFTNHLQQPRTPFTSTIPVRKQDGAQHIRSRSNSSPALNPSKCLQSDVTTANAHRSKCLRWARIYIITSSIHNSTLGTMPMSLISLRISWSRHLGVLLTLLSNAHSSDYFRWVRNNNSSHSKHQMQPDIVLILLPTFVHRSILIIST